MVSVARRRPATLPLPSTWRRCRAGSAPDHGQLLTLDLGAPARAAPVAGGTLSAGVGRRGRPG
eukprot:1720547-Alexandrium_andersonii.AAC.1